MDRAETMRTRLIVSLSIVVIALTPAMGVAQTAADADYDSNGRVDFGDFVVFAKSFGRRPGQTGYNAGCDFDGSGKVDFSDFVGFARLFGQTVPGRTPTYRISGRITEGGAGLGDLTVTLRGEVDTSVTTDEDGIYVFGAVEEGTYAVVPHTGTHVFTPDSVVITVSGSDLSGKDFVAWQSPYTARLPLGTEMVFVWIRPGSFLMGSPPSEPRRGSDEGPQHEVTISKGFYLGQYEVTQEQWDAVLGTAPWLSPRDRGLESGTQVGPDYPAVHLSWNDVQAFVQRLNTVAGDSLYRPPTEGEWEYACRAGTTTRWSFGDEESQLKDYAWYQDSATDIGENHPHKGGSKLPNPWGLFDMHGNVWEWCRDWHGSYSSDPEVDPLGPSEPLAPEVSKFRVLRGGRYDSSAEDTRSAARYRHQPPPDYRGHPHGFRLLRMAE